MMRNEVLVILSLALTTLTSCFFQKPPVNRDNATPLTTVEHVDLEQYLGTWFEVARFENSFQDTSTTQHCVNTRAEYSLDDDKANMINVVNRCHINTPDGEESVAKGTAKILDPESNAKLGVKFFFLAPNADYWILALGEHYEYSLVGEPEGRYLWILSRSEILSEELLNEVLSKARKLGYKTDNLRFDPKYHR